MTNDVTRIVLVRHGEAVCGVEGVVGGPKGCTGLSDEGRRQVDRLRDRWDRTREVDADVLMSSVLPRARETAEILAPALGGPEIVEDCDLCELHPGEIDGRKWAELDVRGFLEDPEIPLSAGGESFSAFKARVDGLMRRLLEEHAGQTVVAACHGGVVMMSMRALFDIPRSDGNPYLNPPNTSITEWCHDAVRWELVRYADAAHLLG